MKKPITIDPELTRLLRLHGLVLPRPHDTWRTIKEPPLGEIVGIPLFRGLAIATNGIIVAIKTSTGQLLFGHYDWFMPDPDEPSLDDAANDVVKRPKALKEYEEFYV